MSVALMTLAWKSKFGSTAKMVLLALCDNANDQGECFPSVPMLAEKCSLSERAVYKQLDLLESEEAIKRNVRNGRSTIYLLNPCTWFTPEPSSPLNDVHPTPELRANEPLNVVHPPLNVVHPTPERGSPITIKEPSSNHQKKEREKAQAPVFVLPDWVDQKVWDAWHSTAKRKKASVEQKQLSLAKLAKWREQGEDYETALLNAADGGWAGLFLPDKKTKPVGGKHSGFSKLDYREGVSADGSLA